MQNLNPRFHVGQRVRVQSADPETGEAYPASTGTIRAILYAETPPDEGWKGIWGEPGYSYCVTFDSPKLIHDIVHESALSKA